MVNPRQASSIELCPPTTAVPFAAMVEAYVRLDPFCASCGWGLDIDSPFFRWFDHGPI